MKKITLQLSIAAFLLLTSINSFAQINFTASPNQGCGPLTVTFTNTSAAPAYRFEWYYNDGSPVYKDTIPKATTIPHTHVFANPGNYGVYIYAYDNTGGYLGYTYGGSGNIQVNGTSFNNPDSTCKNDQVNFCGNGNGNNSNSYIWNFGDGGTANGNNCVNHAYSSNGTYVVTLTADMGCGNQTVTRNIVVANSVKPNPGAWTNGSNVSCPAAPIGFGTGGYASYSWNFGDSGSGANNTSALQNPSHTFSTIGSYTVTLTVTNGCGKTGTASTTVSIVSNPAWPNQSWFKMDVNSSPSCPNSNVSFNAPNGYTNYLWNFGDGSPTQNTSNNYNNHTYGSTLATYTVSVKISRGCGNDTTLYNSVVINNNGFFPNQSSFKINSNSLSCPNSGAAFNAPGGYSSYQWTFGDGSPVATTTNQDITHNYGGTLATYTVSVKITNGCNKDSTLYTTIQIKNNVFFPTQDFHLDAGPSPACPGDNVNWYAPNGYASYVWDFGDGDSALSTRNDANHAYLTAGTYNGSVKITNGCGKDTTLYGTISVNGTGSFPNWLQVEANTSACPNDLLDFRVNQNGFKSYSWNFGDGSPLITSNVEKAQHTFISTGTYNVTCTITNGCSNTTSVSKVVQVTGSSPVNSNIIVRGVQNPSCPNDNVFFVIDEGGQPNYKYYWNYGDGSAIDTTVGSGGNHTYTTTGSYTVTTTVTNGCGMTKAFTTTQTVSNTSFPTLVNSRGEKQWGFPGSDNNGGTSSNAGCSGDAIIFYFMGEAANNLWDFGDGNTGTATESMLVYGGDGSFPVTIIKHSFSANGPYKIKLTLTNNCNKSVTDSMMINIGGNQLVNGDMTTSPPPFTTCAPIDFLAFGGSNYQYDFGDNTTLSTSSPTVTHTFAAQGNYLVTVLVTNGCGNTATYSRSVNVNGVGGPAVALSSSANPTCINDNDGTATVSVTSGNPPYIYSWDDVNAQNVATATGLSSGLYNVKVTDGMGCATTLAVQINNPASIVLGFSKTNAGCGAANGTATVSVSSGGTGPYTYQWSSGATGATAVGLASGGYIVVATDSKGCTSSANVSISETNGATLAVNTATNVSCNGNSTGAIDINVSGATPPYIYLWSNGATTQDLSGLSAGNYAVQVTDNSGCKSSLNISLTQPATILPGVYVSKSPTCGNFDGTATASVSGGTSPYTYHWDAGTGGTGQTTQTATGLPAGSYTVTITDNKGCTMDGEVSLSNSNAPNINAVQTDVTCNGLSNGAIDITVTGGTSPYLYTWNVSPPNTQDKTGLSAGTYIVFVNDAKGCLSFRSYTINQPAVLTTTVSATGANCNSNNGTATASPLGGNVPYSYLWTGGKTTQVANNLSIGSYTVTVTDNKGCTAKATTNISAGAPTPSLCMVTVDDASVNNIIYWDKTQYQHIDSFIVYRETSTNIYKRIAALKDTALSQYIDINRAVGPANGDPNVGAYRYKLQLRDSCGNYSALSAYHNTIYIIDAGNGNFDWNLPYTIEGGANPVANYNLDCDLANANSWFATGGSVTGTQSSVGDPSFLTRPGTARWRVSTAWSITCTPTRSGINTTRSNIKSSAASTGILNKLSNGEIQLYPNPATETVTIQYAAGYKKYQLQVFDALGQVVYNETLASIGTSNGLITKQLDVSTFKKGIYIVNIQTENGSIFKRLAIQ